MRARVALTLTAAGLLVLGVAGTAEASITVANQNDSGPGSLRQALAEASPGETIVVPAGTYTLTSEPLKVTKSVTISGHGSGDTIVRSGGAFRVLAVTGPLNAAISGITIRDGSATAPAEGGGIFAIKADLDLRGVVVTKNTVHADGAAGNSGGSAEGGGIWAVEGSLKLADSQVTENTATALGGAGKNGGSGEGGGIWVAEGAATISNSTVSGNRIELQGGLGAANASQNGGVGEGGGVWVVEGDASISDSTFNDNKVSAVGGNGAHGGVTEGGGIWVAEGAATISNSTFSGNVADSDGGAGPASTAQNGGVGEGGGVWVAEGALNIGNSKVTANSVRAVGGTGAHGGVVEGGGVWAEGSLSIAGSTISGNSADGRGGQGPTDVNQYGGTVEGGGLWAVQDSKETAPASVIGSAVANNIADGSGGPGAKSGFVEGGGVWEVTESVPITFARTTVASNAARSAAAVAGGGVQGGGLWGIQAKTGSLAMTGVTLANNRLEISGPVGPAAGGNLFAEAISIGDSIVAGGVGPAGSENCSQPIKVTSLGFNLDSLDQCGFHAVGDQVGKDPLLGPVQDNGGPTATMAPAAASPAIDQGSGLGLTTDQRGVIRPIDLPSIPNSSATGADGSDIGAYELQPSNAFKLGKLKKNKRKGTATLSVTLPRPSAGILVLGGKGLKSQRIKITGQGRVKFKVAAKGRTKKALRRNGKRKVKIKVSYAPTGNTPVTKSRSTKLIRKAKAKKR